MAFLYWPWTLGFEPLSDDISGRDVGRPSARPQGAGRVAAGDANDSGAANAVGETAVLPRLDSDGSDAAVVGYEQNIGASICKDAHRYDARYLVDPGFEL